MKFKLLAAVAGLAIAGAGAAKADTYTYTMSPGSTFSYDSYGVTSNTGVTISGPGNGSYLPALNFGAGSGQILLSGTGANSGQTLVAWCIDVLTWLQPYNDSGTFTYTATTPPADDGTVGSASNPATITNPTILGEIGGLVAYGDALVVPGSGTNLSAAVQLAIWSVEYGKNYSFVSGSAAVNTLASQLVTDIEDGSIAPWNNWTAITEETGSPIPPGTPVNQELAVLTLTPPPPPTGRTAAPEPASMVLLASGLIGLGALRRRRG
jgi:PEP-CTERM motif